MNLDRIKSQGRAAESRAKARGGAWSITWSRTGVPPEKDLPSVSKKIPSVFVTFFFFTRFFYFGIKK